MEQQLQRTDAWLKERKYKYTSSCVFKLLTDPKTNKAKDAGELSETAKTYILEKLTEELDGFIPDFENDATRWGEATEASAKYWYQYATENKIVEVGFIPYNDFYGGSPDAKVIDVDGELGGLEIKCPYNSVNHLKHCLISDAEYMKAKHPEYYWQCVSHMITLDVNWCDFVSFDPRLDNDLGLKIIRIYRNNEDAKELLKRIEAANNYKNELKIKLGLL